MSDEAARNEQGDFGFKALKQMTKLTFKHERFDEALGHYKTLLTYTRKGVTRNVAEKAINRILDYVSAEPKLGTEKMQEFYEVTMNALEEQKNDVSSISMDSRARGLETDHSDRARAAFEHENESQIGQIVVRSSRVQSTQQGRYLHLQCDIEPGSHALSLNPLDGLTRSCGNFTHLALPRTTAPTSTLRKARLSLKCTRSRFRCTGK